MFDQDQISFLLTGTGKPILDRPPWNGTEKEIIAFYRNLVGSIIERTGFKAQVEWDAYGSGYASFIDAWFYVEEERFSKRAPKGSSYCGVAVPVSRKDIWS